MRHSPQKGAATEPDIASPVKKTENHSLRGKLTDELDRMRVELEHKKQATKPYVQPLTMISDYSPSPKPQRQDYALNA